MHEKCIILRFEIVVFSVMGPSSLNGQHRRFGLDLLHPSSVGLCRQTPGCSYQNIYNHVCTRQYGVLTQTILRIITTVSTSNLVPKLIKNWNVHGKVTLRKLNYSTAVYIVTYHLMSHTFSTTVNTVSKTEETNHSQYKHTFYDQEHISWISNFYYSYMVRKLNRWSWNKTAYMAMKS